LLAQVDRRLGLIDRLVGCFNDERNPLLVKHKLRELLAQRVFAIALGYEDLNDHEQLRHDPLLGIHHHALERAGVTGRGDAAREEQGQAEVQPHPVRRAGRS